MALLLLSLFSVRFWCRLLRLWVSQKT
ncbi:hypothetical protein D046_1376A, partial [Vibrio parahaemolyticus V-223/04]